MSDSYEFLKAHKDRIEKAQRDKDPIRIWAKRLLDSMDSEDAAHNDPMLKEDPLARTFLVQGIWEDIAQCRTELKKALEAHEKPSTPSAPADVCPEHLPTTKCLTGECPICSGHRPTGGGE